MVRLSQADWQLRAATRMLVVASIRAGKGQAASAAQITAFRRSPPRHPSARAKGLASSVSRGVASQVLKKSAPRARINNNSSNQYSALPKATNSWFTCFRRSAPDLPTAPRSP